MPIARESVATFPTMEAEIVSRRPLFSTYSQGENRVTGSMIAVFERLDLATLERILAAAIEESALQLVTFDLVRPEGPGTVPDARIAASFKYLFEVKTAYGALRSDQLAGHLAKMDGSHADERLFVLTPDPEEPPVIGGLDPDRVRWASFTALSEAIDGVLKDETEPIPDDERFLLRELMTLFSQEGLLGKEDMVVVAAGNAYGFYLRHSAYVCQSGRPFRPGISRMGFYRRRNIEPHVPRIEHRRDAVPFSHDEANRLRASGDATDVRIGDLIAATVASGEQTENLPFQVFLLSAPDADATFRLPAPIRHDGPSAWTMGQRYAFFEKIRAAPATTSGLR